MESVLFAAFAGRRPIGWIWRVSMCLILQLGFSVAADTESPVPHYEAELIFPAERFHNHSPTLVETPKGDLIAAWFHGQGERKDNSVRILGARRAKGSRQWYAPFVLADNPGLPDQNPTLFIDPQKRLWLFWISSLDNEVRGHFLKYRIATDYEEGGPPRWSWQDWLPAFPRDLESTDGGMTWTEDPVDLPCPGSSVAAVGLRNGHWILVTNQAAGRHVLTVYLSEDEGRTWKWRRDLENFEPGKGTGQYPSLIQDAAGFVHAVYTHGDAAALGDKLRTIKHVRFNEAWVQAAGR